MEYQCSVFCTQDNRAETSYITDNVPGGLGCLNRDCISGEEVTFFDCFLEALSVQFLNSKTKKKMCDDQFLIV